MGYEDRTRFPKTDMVSPSLIIAQVNDKYWLVDGRTQKRILRSQDAYTVIQSAVDSLPDGGTIHIKAGTYPLSSPLTLKPRIILQGDGMDVTRLTGQTGISYVINATSDTVEYGGGLKDLYLGGDPTIPTVLRVNNLWKFFVHNVRIYGGAGPTAIEVVNSAYEADIRNCRITHYTDYGIKAHANGIVIDNNDFAPASGTAVTIQAGVGDQSAGNAVRITNNWFEASGTNGGTWIQVNGAKYTFIYANNLGSNFAAQASSFGIKVLANSLGTKIFGNYISTGYGTGIWASGAAAYYTIIAENVIETDQAGALRCIYDDRGFMVIKGNIFIVTQAPADVINVTAGAVNGVIDGNLFLALTSKTTTGIAYNGSRYNITGNTFRFITTPIDCNNTTAYANIVYNDFQAFTAPAIANVGTNKVLKHNRGYVTENGGTATVLAGSTSVSVSHGLATTPTRVLITPVNDPGGRVWVSAVGASTFTINITTAPAVDVDFYWQAEVTY